MTHRRAFLGTLAAALVSVPRAAQAQASARVHRVGFIVTSAPVSELAGPEPTFPTLRAFLHGLRTLGYAEGRNLALIRRSAEGRFDRLGDIVAEMIRDEPNVIVTVGHTVAWAAKAQATTIPIVMVTSSDPVGDGLVQSFARPGGNFTGFTTFVGPEIEEKRLELLKEALPRVSRVAYLASKENKDWELPRAQGVRNAAQRLGITIIPAEHSPRDYTDAFTLMSRSQVHALFVSPSPVALADRGVIVDLAARARLPSSFAYREPVELGGLMSYGVSLSDILHGAAGYVDKILKGARPGDLPVVQPGKFELVINLKSANRLGVTISPLLLQRADEVMR